MTHTIEIKGLGVRYGRAAGDEAIKDLSLTLEGGLVHGLLGRNGSGKTTLLSVIAGFRAPNAGQVLVGGEVPFENPRRTPEICLVREEGLAADADSVRGVLDLHRRWRPAWDEDYATHLLDMFEVPFKRTVTALSRGQQSALGIVVGLASRAPVTMFDEAYLGLDAPSRYAFYDELLRDYAEQPRTLVLSTHLIEELGSLFEQVTMIDDGRLVLHESADELGTRGATVTGPTSVVERFIEGRTVLNRQSLGGTTAATVDGKLSATDEQAARNAGLDLGPVGLQDLFVHLTHRTDPKQRETWRGKA